MVTLLYTGEDPLGAPLDDLDGLTCVFGVRRKHAQDAVQVRQFFSGEVLQRLYLL